MTFLVPHQIQSLFINMRQQPTARLPHGRGTWVITSLQKALLLSCLACLAAPVELHKQTSDASECFSMRGCNAHRGVIQQAKLKGQRSGHYHLRRVHMRLTLRGGSDELKYEDNQMGQGVRGEKWNSPRRGRGLVAGAQGANMQGNRTSPSLGLRKGSGKTGVGKAAGSDDTGGAIVVDMRTPEEIAMLQKAGEQSNTTNRQAGAEAERKREAEREREAATQTEPHTEGKYAAEVCKMSAMFLPEIGKSFPRLNLTTEELLHAWNEVQALDTPAQQLVDAAAANDVPEIEALLLRHVKVDSVDYLNMTALMKAAEEGHAEAVCALLQHGADTEARDDDGWTALHYASEGGHPLVVEILLRAGANADVYHHLEPQPGQNSTHGGQGASPLHLARRWMDRAGVVTHALYDPRGGDAYWRIECLLLEYGASEWIGRTPDEPRRQQSVRLPDPDGTLQKEAFFEPLTDVEKFELEPEYFRPEKIIMRRMHSDGIRPDDTNLLAIAKSYGYIATPADEATAKELKAQMRPRSQTQDLAPIRRSQTRRAGGSPKPPSPKTTSSDASKAKPRKQVREASPPPKPSTH